MPSALLQLMRPAHWAKNVFVLSPLIFAQKVQDTEALARSVLAFVAFCAVSSTVYIFNDYLDRHEDRNHPVKRLRPLAAGTVAPGAAMVLASVLLMIALGITAALGVPVLAITLIYLLLNVLYTHRLKHMVILDVMIVSVGFVLRVEVGGLAIGVEVSAWLLLCTFLLALFLAFSKRRHELMLLAEDASVQRKVLTHYSPAFLDQMINVVTASTVVSYALYAISPDTVERFDTRALIYTIPFVLFGIFRYLFLIYQQPNQLNPTEAVVRDKPSLLNILLWGLVVLATIYLV